MSNPSTPQPSKSKHKSKSKSRRRNRRGSGASNASIISIDHVSLKKLRKFQEKVAKENKKQKKLYQQQKQSKFEDYTKKFVQHEFKEEDENLYGYDDGYDVNKGNKTDSYYDENTNNNSAYDSSSSYSSKNKDAFGGNKQQMEDITVEELLPIIKNLVDKYNALQQEYDIKDRELREKNILLEDKINQLQQMGDNMSVNSMDIGNGSGNNLHNNNQMGMSRTSMMRSKLIREYEDKIEILKNNYEDNLLRVQSQYQQEIDQQNKNIKNLNKELNDADKENDALRQSLEALEHENQSLRISMNNNNKQFQNMKILKSKNKQLNQENTTLRQQLEVLEEEMNELVLKQQQEEQDRDHNAYLNASPASPIHRGTIGGNMRPQTPTHAYAKTLVMGNRDSLEVGSNKGSLHNLSDHESSMGGNDLLHQIQDYQDNASVEQYQSNHSSVDPPDRDSNYGDNIEEQEEEKKINDDNNNNTNNDESQTNTIANLQKYKDIGDMDPASMQQILALLQEKEKQRLLRDNQHTGHSQPSQDVMDAYSVESNYSDSEQKLEEQIDNIEDDIRELKDMVLSLMDSTNNITPQVNANLGPLVRKINRMYVMLSGPMGPMESRTSPSMDDASSAKYSNNRRRNRNRIYNSDYETDSDYNPDGSQHSSRTGSNKNDNDLWLGWMTPYINDWMPSIGFSAIILSTMYLLIKYQGKRLPIGQPRVLRNKR